MTKKEYMNILWMCVVGTKIALIDTSNYSIITYLIKVMLLVALAYLFVSVDGKSEK